ncbi:MAG: aminotransferase class V-fold PLP-dependent enzyme [candidate division Zixibacteria bacterium]|nr:aminotransferase class V-fold PLP-dependent enzyme [candidate division Zixibacteria bacterium]
MRAVSRIFEYLNLERKSEHGSWDYFAPIEKIRVLAAKLIGAGPDEIGISPNTSYGFNLAAQGLEFKKGDEVLVPEGEFPAGVYPWLNLKFRGVRIKFIRSEAGFFSFGNFLKAVNKKTKLVSVGFVQSFNGFKIDLEAIGIVCREKSIVFVVDGIQGVGNQEIDVKKCGIDLLTCGGQKWLLSPPGSGFFYVSRKLQKKIRPAFFGWMGVDWQYCWDNLRIYDKPPFESARRYEIGSYPYADLAGMAASLEMIEQIGVRKIQRHTLELLDYLIGYLQESGLRIVSNLDPLHRSAILTFAAKNAKSLHRQLMQKQIICSFREGNIRISPHFYNTPAEIDRLISALGKFGH